MRKREIREYSITSGIRKSRANNVRAGAFGVLTIGLVIGICGLATVVSQQTDHLVAANAAQNRPNTDTITTKPDVTTGTPAPMLATLADPTAKTTTETSSGTSANAPRMHCNTVKRAKAVTQRNSQLRSETTRHDDMLWSLKTTGLVTKFLNPYMYTSRLDQENSYHKAILTQIEHRYQTAMAYAHC